MNELDSNALRSVGTLSRAIHSKSDFKFKQLGLQKGQYMFLTRVCENYEINLVDLSTMLKVDKATTTKAVKKLIDLGYINKKQNEKDKREYQLTPTRKGVQIYNLLIKEEKKQLDISFDGFTQDEKVEATKLLERMSKNIDKYWLGTSNN